MQLKNSSNRSWGSLKLNLGALLLAAVAGLLLYGYYVLSPSYSASKEAKRLYERGEYEAALKLAESIEAEHSYNIMAFSVAEQARRAIKWRRFIDMSKTYWLRVEEFSRKKTFNSADLATIRIMAEAVLYDYAKLGNPGPLMDKKLTEEADYYHQQFSALYQELFPKPDPKVSGTSGAGSRPQR